MSQRHSGFTLIELLVTMTILGVGLTVAVPSMIGFQRSAQLTSAVSTLTTTLGTARGEAMKRNMRALVLPASGNDWASGYQVVMDVDRTGTLTTGDITVLSQPALPANLEVVGFGTAIATPSVMSFDGSGYAPDAASGMGVTIRRLDTKGKPDEFAQTRHIVIARTGRVRTCKPASATDVNCGPTAF